MTMLLTQSILTIPLLFLGLVHSQPANIPEKASTRFDPVHLDAVLADPKMRENYIRCLMDKGVCTPEAFEVKSVLPIALINNCEKCNKRQKTNSDKTIQYLMDQEPEIFQKISAKYDPKGAYKKWFTPSPKKDESPTTPTNKQVVKDSKKNK